MAGLEAFPGLPRDSVPSARETAYTYEALHRASSTLALGLRSLGVKKGDRVAVSLGNCGEFAALTYAVFKLGAVLVPLNPAFGAAQVAAALAHLGAVVLVVGAVADRAYKPCRGRSNLGLLRAVVPDLHRRAVESPATPSLRHVVVVDNTADHPAIADADRYRPARFSALTPFSDLMAGSDGGGGGGGRGGGSFSAVVPDAPLDPAETINIQFTSGTTAHPKAAMLSHRAILNNGALIAHRMGLTPADLVVCPPPLFHCFGSVLGYMATATTGAAILFPSPAFDPAASLAMAADRGATGLYGVATMFVAMLEALDRLPPSLRGHDFAGHLRTGIAAGSSVPEALMARLFDRLGLRDLVICYGMTETVPVSCMTSPDDPIDRRTGSVGRPMPHTAVKIVDSADRARVLPLGRRGELAASGYLVMDGYWADEARTREVRVWEGEDGGRDGEAAEDDEAAEAEGDTNGPDDGRRKKTSGRGGRVWMYSGDEASMDADGYVSITGRIKDVVIRAGENIHPLEIENCLFQHPHIVEASVVGVPDPRYGEAVVAFVVVARRQGQREGEGEARVQARAAEGISSQGDRRLPADGDALTEDDVRDWVRGRLSGHLVPEHVFWVDEYPKTASGKIQKYRLRDMARELVSAKKAQGLGRSESS